jgi:hypothetical protein
MHNLRLILAQGAIAALVVACSSGGAPAASTAPPAASSAPPASPTTPAAATHTSTGFVPQITYVLPVGWTTDVDEAAEWRILPPGSTHAGAEDSTSDAIAIHVRIAASAADCSGVPQPGIGQTPTAIATYWAQLPGLTTTVTAPFAEATPVPQPVTVGGLTGVVLDISMAKSWTKPCPQSNGTPVVPLIVGLINTDLDHPIAAGWSIRAYLLGLNGGTLAIEVQDVTGGSHFAQYAAVIQTFQFKQ